MAQADYIISNQTFPNTRADINNHLSAIATNNSGTSAPTTQYAGQFWIDTTSSTWTLYIHDGTDDIQFATIDTSANTVNFIDSALDVVTDTTPQLGGDLDLNSNDITGTGNINITGTATVSGDLTVDTDTLYVDSASNRVGIGTDSPSQELHIVSTQPSILFEDSDNNGQALIDVSGGNINISSDPTGALASSNIDFLVDNNQYMRIASGGDISFYEDTGTTPKFFWDASAERLGIGTSSPNTVIDARETKTGGSTQIRVYNTDNSDTTTQTAGLFLAPDSRGNGALIFAEKENADFSTVAGRDVSLVFSPVLNNSQTEAMRIDSSGNVQIGTTNTTPASNGVEGTNISQGGQINIARNSGASIVVGRNTNDGTIISFKQDGSTEGLISVSGTTVSYNGGHLSRWSQLLDNTRDESILKGTVMSNLDEMCVWGDEDNEQLNKMKVSDTEGDDNVAGVFVNWDNDDDVYTNDMNIAMTGDMVIRIAQGVTVTKGQLLMSAGDGTAKPQGDDIVRSKTIAKITSNNVTKTYDDGSYLVPCVLMAC